MLRNKIGPSFDAKKKCFFLFFWLVFLKISLPAERRGFLKNKRRKKEKHWTKFWLKKGYFWTKFWLYSRYIYIYIPISVFAVNRDFAKGVARTVSFPCPFLPRFFFFSFVGLFFCFFSPFSSGSFGSLLFLSICSRTAPKKRNFLEKKQEKPRKKSKAFSFSLCRT